MATLCLLLSAITGVPRQLAHAEENAEAEQSQDELLTSELSEALRVADAEEEGWMGPIPFILVDRFYLWPTGKVVTVCFVPYSESLKASSPVKESDARQFVVTTADEWHQKINIGFDFGAPPYRECAEEASKAEISITFSGGSYANWSKPGNKSPLFYPSMSLGRVPRGLGDFTRGIVLHEFGHAIGFQHEMLSGSAACGANLDEAKVLQVAAAMWNDFIPSNITDPAAIAKEKARIEGRVKLEIMRVLEGKGYACSAYDNRSVMGYPLSAKYFKDGYKEQCESYAPSIITPTDLTLAAAAYPATQSQQEDFKKAYPECRKQKFFELLQGLLALPFE